MRVKFLGYTLLIIVLCLVGSSVYDKLNYTASVILDKAPSQQTLIQIIDKAIDRFKPAPIASLSEDNRATEIPILMYHDVITEDNYDDGNKLPVSNFRKHIQYLADAGFRTLTVDEFIRFHRGELDVPQKSVLITFDDGFRSVKDLIEPILKEYNMHAVSFIIGEKLVEPYFVTKEEITQMAAENYFEFQSHGQSVHKAGSNGRGLIETIDSTTFKEDELQMKQIIGSYQMFCYPFGHHGLSAHDNLSSEQIEYAVTVEYGKATRASDGLALPRLRVNAGTTVDDLAAMIEP